MLKCLEAKVSSFNMEATIGVVSNPDHQNAKSEKLK